MDQNAFRSLLSAPRPTGSGSSSRQVLGAPPPKRGWGLKSKEGYEKKHESPQESKPEFAPRQHMKKEAKDSRYKDRAEVRRQGADDEFKPVEKLLEDFESRKANATAEQLAEIEKQRAYLGGDAEHSVLVKGLDHALLAARKAELAREQGGDVDKELEALGKGLGKVKGLAKGKAKEEKPKEEDLGSGFKSIAQKKADAEAAAEKKKKKKKKKKTQVSEVIAPVPSADGLSVKPEAPVDISDPFPQPAAKSPAPLPPVPSSDDEDIFGDAGEYDLAAAAGNDSDTDEDQNMDVDEPGEITRGRIKSRSRSRDDRSSSQERSKSRRRGYGRGLGPRSPGYRHSRSRSRSREYRNRPRSRSRDYRRRYSRSPSYDKFDRRRSPSPYRPRHRSYSRSRSPSPRYERSEKRRRTSYGRSPLPPRRMYDSVSRSPSPRPRDSFSPRRRYSPLPRRDRSPSLPTRERARTRSLSPILQDPYSVRSPSRSPSPSSDEGPSTRLQPLASSTIPSIKSFLAADEAGAKAALKKANKAKWRAQQGMSAQEGAEEEYAAGKKGRGMNEKQRANRDYQLLMNKMDKEKKKKDE